MCHVYLIDFNIFMIGKKPQTFVWGFQGVFKTIYYIYSDLGKFSDRKSLNREYNLSIPALSE